MNAYLIRRQATTVASPFNDAIASTQIQLARLRGQALVPRRRDEDRATLMDELERLSSTVRARQLDFMAAVDKLEAPVAKSDRIADTLKAFDRTFATIRLIKATLGGA